ncbi:flavodoxin family protein [Nanoarchaeota archaeon]
MKALVVYYSRTGTTRKAGKAIASELKCDVYEITSPVKRGGPIGYMKCGREGMRKMLTKIDAVKNDPAEYDIIVIGTPVWAWNMSSPVRTYLRDNKDKFKKVAFFCTMGGQGDDKTFASMKEECGKEPVATLALITKEVMRGNPEEKIKGFVGRLR